MIAETLAGISLLKASVDFIKSNIDTAKDIGEIAGAVDGLFRGNDEVQAERSKKSGVTIGDQFGIKSVAQEMIDAKLAEEKLNEMRTMLNMRFGPDTWQSIVDERSRRIAEIKEADKRARIEKRRKDNELWDLIKSVMIIGAAILIGLGAFMFVIFEASK